MKSILAEDFISEHANATRAEAKFRDDSGNVVYETQTIAKPLDYAKDFMPEDVRKGMAQEVLDGHAVAVHFTEDEVNIGETPTLCTRFLNGQGGDASGKMLYDRDVRAIKEKVAGLSNSDLFVSVRQQVAAYKLYRRFWKCPEFEAEDEYEYLDGAYRFLNGSVEPKFILFCAKEEKMDPVEYLAGLLGENDEKDV